MEGEPSRGRGMKRGDAARIGDGTGEARVLAIKDGFLEVLYPSGARRTVHARNVATPGEPTPTERKLLAAALESGGVEAPGPEWRTAALALTANGCLVEEGRALVLTAEGEAAARRVAA